MEPHNLNHIHVSSRRPRATLRHLWRWRYLKTRCVGPLWRKSEKLKGIVITCDYYIFKAKGTIHPNSNCSVLIKLFFLLRILVSIFLGCNLLWPSLSIASCFYDFLESLGFENFLLVGDMFKIWPGGDTEPLRCFCLNKNRWLKMTVHKMFPKEMFAWDVFRWAGYSNHHNEILWKSIKRFCRHHYIYLRDTQRAIPWKQQNILIIIYLSFWLSFIYHFFIIYLSFFYHFGYHFVSFWLSFFGTWSNTDNKW